VTPGIRGGVASPALVVLLGSDLAIWAAFYALMPYLPERIMSLGYSGTLAGVILAVRLLSQQGTMPVSGAVADRWGYRRALLTGLLLRTAGFALMATVTSASLLVLTAVLSGAGGSLIGAAFKATYTEAPGGADLPTRFLWLTIADRLGQVAGPLLGEAAGAFPAKACLAAGLFLAVAAAVRLWLPEQQPTGAGPVWESVLAQVRDRRLAWLVVLLCGYWAIQQQMSVLIPLAAALLGAHPGVGMLFSLSALTGLALLLFLPRLHTERLWQRLLLAHGLTAGAMAIPAALPHYGGVVMATVVLAMAAVLGQPAIDALVSTLAPASGRGSTFGFAALSFGVGGALGQVAGGWAWTRWGEPAPWLPWLLFTALGLLTLAGLQLLRKGVAADERDS